MNQHLGATYALSVIVVISSAIAFYRADGAKSAPKPSNTVSKSQAPQRPRPEVVSRRVAEAAAAPSLRPSSERQATAVVATSRTSSIEAETTVPSSVGTTARQVSRVSDRPRSGFTRVDDGEGLADVARRLYGSPDMAGALWRVNRDQLPAPTAPLEPGMMLRTP
jgi:hypothetical protein